MRENGIEEILVRTVRRLGGKAVKNAVSYCKGFPDRSVFLPGGRVVFVELKAPGKKLQQIQNFRKAELESLGFAVEIIDSITAVKEFEERYARNI